MVVALGIKVLLAAAEADSLVWSVRHIYPILPEPSDFLGSFRCLCDKPWISVENGEYTYGDSADLVITFPPLLLGIHTIGASLINEIQVDVTEAPHPLPS